MLAFYDGDVDTDLYAKDFVTAYNAGLRGETRPVENYITEGQAVAAYTAGQNDMKTASNGLNLRQEDHIMSKNDAGSDYIERAAEAGDEILAGKGKPDTGGIETVSGTAGNVPGGSRVRLAAREGRGITEWRRDNSVTPKSGSASENESRFVSDIGVDNAVISDAA